MNPELVFDTDALKLRVCRTKKFKAGLLSVSAVLPIEAESAPLTSLLLSVLRRGTEKYPSLEEINRRLDYLYGTELSIRNFYRGDCQIIGFSAELLDSRFLPSDIALAEEVTSLLCQILYHPLLDENGLLQKKYVESEKQFQCEAIRSIKNNPRAYASEQCNALLYQHDACGASVYGTEEMIQAVTPEALTDFWRTLVKRLSFDCFYVGAAEPSEISGALERTLGTEAAVGFPRKMPRSVKAVSSVETPYTGYDQMAVGQSQLLMGYTVDCVIGSPDYHACLVFNELLGCSPVSRLFVYVREKLSLCYHCSSFYHSAKGTLVIQCGLHRDHRARAEEEILHQLLLLASGDFEAAELEAAKKSLISTYRQTEDSPAAAEGFYFGRSLASFAETVEECIEAISHVTAEQVIAVAQRLKPHTVYFLEGTLEGGEEDDDEDN